VAFWKRGVRILYLGDELLVSTSTSTPHHHHGRVIR
jgi:hypothetical protein